MTKDKCEVGTLHLMVPMFLMSLTMTLFLAYQTTQVMKDRSALNQTEARMTSPFTESNKLNNQFGGLVSGTQKLALDGNEDARELVKRLIQLGILPDPAQQAPKAPVPVANEALQPGPVKP